MTAETGVIFLVLAMLVAGFSTGALWPSLPVRERVTMCLVPAAWLQALLVASAFACLVMLRIDSDFSVANVFLHSNLTLPTLYKITGTWGNHEGSMLLWALVLVAFGLALACSKLDLQMKALALSVQSGLTFGVLLFILFTSNPFVRKFPPPADGQTLNPILQDVALAIHPPLLYVGYVGFSIVFSLAVAALLAGTAGREFAKIIRPYLSFAWLSLTLGIGLGSWWAYRELGWGGFWFWDPVENASLLPWLAATALMHSNIVLEKRGQLASWVLLLVILTFALSLIGTFLVRSGALTSVHSFASDPARGLFILGYIVVTVGGALFLYAARAGRMESPPPMAPVSREGMIVFNNLFLLSACAIVFLGTLYPLFAEWLSGEKLTVGPPYFKATFVPVMMLPLLLAGLTPLMAWKKAEIRQNLQSARHSLMAAALFMFIALVWFRPLSAYGILGTGLGVWLAGSSIQWLRMGWHRLPRPYVLAVFLGHLGAAMVVLGVTGAGVWQQEQEQTVVPGAIIRMAGYEIRYDHETRGRGNNFEGRTGEFLVKRHGRQVAALYPEYRRYDIRGTVTHEAAIHSTLFGDLYISMGEATADGHGTSARVYYMPFVSALWLGCLLMAAGAAMGIVHSRKTRA